MNTYELVRRVISEECSVPIDKIFPETNILEDLGIDSLDVLDIVYRIDQDLRIKIPVDQWIDSVNQTRAEAAEYFVVSAFCEKLDALLGSSIAE